MEAVRLRKKPLVGFSLASAEATKALIIGGKMTRPPSQQQQTSRSHVNLILFGPILRLMRHPLFFLITSPKIEKHRESSIYIYSSSLVGANRKQRFVHVSARAPRYFDEAAVLLAPSSHLFFLRTL